MKKEQQLSYFVPNSSLTNWAKANKTETSKPIFYEMFAHDELKRRIDYIMKTALLKHYYALSYRTANIYELSKKCRSEIVVRCREEISLAYTYTP